MSIDEQEKDNDENKEKGLASADSSKGESVSGIEDVPYVSESSHQCYHIMNIFHVWAIHHPGLCKCPISLFPNLNSIPTKPVWSNSNIRPC